MTRMRHTGMRAAAGFLPVAALLGLATGFALPGTVLAEDEDTSASVYLVFDPETGEFITEDHPEAALPHQTGLEEPGLANAEQAADGAEDASEQSAATVSIVIAASVLLLGGGFFLVRRSRRDSA